VARTHVTVPDSEEKQPMVVLSMLRRRTFLVEMVTVSAGEGNVTARRRPTP
jgi:hypothetical protein